MEKAFSAQVLVYVGPVNAKATASQAPVRTLSRSRRQQTGIPGEGHRDRSAVQEIDDQGVIREADTLDALTWFYV
jgi:hypothetical protein